MGRPPGCSFSATIWLCRPRVNGRVCLRLSIPESLGLAPIDVNYLGYVTNDDGNRTHCFSGELDEATQLPDGFVAQGLRSLFGQLDDIELALAGRAVQIVNWERTHRFCGRCGSPTEAVENERAKLCPNCGLSNYPRLSPAIIIAITRQTARRSAHPAGQKPPLSQRTLQRDCGLCRAGRIAGGMRPS